MLVWNISETCTLESFKQRSKINKYKIESSPQTKRIHTEFSEFTSTWENNFYHQIIIIFYA